MVRKPGSSAWRVWQAHREGMSHLQVKIHNNLWLRSWNCLESLATLLFLFFLSLIAHLSLNFHE